MAATLQGPDVGRILDSLNDGVYATDRERRIIYWNAAAERITGWKADDVVGEWCGAGILCHVDKDDHALCGRDFCPLHRAMESGRPSERPVIVYARHKEGTRVPTAVSLSPIRDETGRVIGGVEVFRDVTETMLDLETACRIQRSGIEVTLPDAAPLRVRSHYVPMEMVGGDFQSVTHNGAGVYSGMQADVMGHGFASALYTMHLRSLWEDLADLHDRPGLFLSALSARLHHLIGTSRSFATGVAFAIDTAAGKLHWAGAGHSPGLLYRVGGQIEELVNDGLPLGLLEDVEYPAMSTPFGPGDLLLLYSDGAIEIEDRTGRILGVDGLVQMLSQINYPRSGVTLEQVEQHILNASNRVRLEDDLALLEVSWHAN